MVYYLLIKINKSLVIWVDYKVINEVNRGWLFIVWVYLCEDL